MDRPRPKILVVGSINVDLVVRAARFPEPGESLVGQELNVVPGGKGANQAAAAARLETDVTFVGRVGDDSWKSLLIDSLAANQIDCSGLVTDGSAKTGTALIIVNDAGENCIVVVPGANQNVGSVDIDAALAQGGPFDAILLQLEIPLETVRHAIRRGRDAGIPVFVDAGPATGVSVDQLAGATVVSPNESEAYALTGIRLASPEDVSKAAHFLRERTQAERVVMKLGEKGASIHDAQGDRFFGARRVEAVDTTAAGDAFTAAYVAQSCRGFEVEECVVYANAAGALAATRLGAQPSLPRTSEVESLLQKEPEPPPFVWSSKE